MRYVGTLLKNIALYLSLGTIYCVGFSPAHAQLFSSRIQPADIVNIVRNRGFSEIQSPYFRGDVYIVDATERRGLRVRLVVDPRTGDIVERLVIGRNNKVYPAGPSSVEAPLGVERQVIDRTYLDNDRQSRSSVEIDEPRSRIQQVRPARKRINQNSIIDTDAPNSVQPSVPNIENTVPQQQQPSQTPSNTVIDTPKNEPAKLPDIKLPQIQSSPTSIEQPNTSSSASTSPSTTKSVEPSLTPTDLPSSGQTQRGTRENPRKVGPIISSPTGMQ